MRKRYAVLEANRAKKAWWAELAGKEAEDLPKALVPLQAGKADETERMSEEQASSVLDWCATLQGWYPSGPGILTQRGDVENKPLVKRGVAAGIAATSSGNFATYSIEQTDHPQAHNVRRGKFYFEPRDYSEPRPYTTGFATAEEALAAAEAHEIELLRRQQEQEAERAAAAAAEAEAAQAGALRVPPWAPRRSSMSAGGPRAGRVAPKER